MERLADSRLVGLPEKSARGWRSSALNTIYKGLLNAIKTPPSHHRRNNRTSSLHITQAHVPASDIAINSHLRDERDAHTRRNHSQQTAELSAFKYNVGRNARACARVETQITEAVAVAQHHERLSAEVFQRERFRGGTRMICAQRRKERLGSYREQLQVLEAQRQRENRHIDREVAQTFHEN